MKELLAVADLTHWNKISTGVFLSIFAALFLWTYRPGAKAVYEKRGRLPLGVEEANDGE